MMMLPTDVITTGFIILILLVVCVYGFVRGVGTLSETLRDKSLQGTVPHVAAVCVPFLAVFAFFVSTVVYHWQDYVFPFMAGLQLRSINTTLPEQPAHIHPNMDDNFTVSILSHHLKGISEMDIEMKQPEKNAYPLRFLIFSVQKRCQGGLLGLKCDMEKEAALAVKNTGGLVRSGRLLRHLCAWNEYMTLTYVNPDTGGKPTQYHVGYRDDPKKWHITPHVNNWYVLAAVHCGCRKTTRGPIQVEGRVYLRGRAIHGYLFLGPAHAVAWFFLMLAMSMLVGLSSRLRRQAATVQKIYQQILNKEPNHDSTREGTIDEKAMERAKRQLQYEKFRTRLNNLCQKYQKAQTAEYDKYSRMRTSRVMQELKGIAADPLPGLVVAQSISNGRYVYFLLKGYEKTPFDGGTYCGMIVLPPNYPSKPPTSFVMLSPSGGYMFRQCTEWNHVRVPGRWNPVMNSLRDYFAKLVTKWLDCKLDYYFTKTSARELAEHSLESSVELCPGFNDLFPYYSSRADDDDDDDGSISVYTTDGEENIDGYVEVTRPKQEKSSVVDAPSSQKIGKFKKD